MLLTILKRLGLAVPTLFGVSLAVFMFLYILPGDPLAGLLAPNATAQDRADLAKRVGLSDPAPVRYLHWLRDVAHGNLGYSFSRRRDVSYLIVSAYENTAILAAAAAAIGLSVGLSLGILAALSTGRWIDRAISSVAVLGLSVPQFWMAILLIIIFSSYLRLLPSAGMNSPDGDWLSGLQHLILPAFTASLVSIGITTRMTRASLLNIYGEDFVLTLRANGLSVWQILLHVLKNAAPPILTVVGLQVGFLLGGSVLIETIFSWPGMGQLVYQAIETRDLAVIQAVVLVSAVTFVLINLLVDVLQTVVNPRLRKEGV